MQRLALVLVLAAGAVSPRNADAQSGLILFGHVGRVWPTIDLNDAGDALSSSLAYGGGLALQVGGGTALRVSITRSAPAFRGTIPLGDSGSARMHFAGALQVGWPGTSTLVPYMLVGIGVVHTDPADGSQAAVSDLAAHVGVGVNRLIDFGALFLEVTGTGYKFSGLGFDRLQIEVAVELGLAVAVAF